MKNILRVFAFLALPFSGSALGERFNIDYGTLNPAPASAFAAAMPQAGYWNAIPSIAVFVPLRDLGGAATPVSIVGSAGLAGGIADPSTPAGGPTRLLDDDVNFPGVSLFTVQNIQAGQWYEVCTYAWGPCLPADTTQVRLRDYPVVRGAWSAAETCGGASPIPFAWVEATNFVRQFVYVTPVAGTTRGNFQIELQRTAGGAGHLNGIQIKPLVGVLGN